MQAHALLLAPSAHPVEAVNDHSAFSHWLEVVTPKFESSHSECSACQMVSVQLVAVVALSVVHSLFVATTGFVALLQSLVAHKSVGCCGNMQQWLADQPLQSAVDPVC